MRTLFVVILSLTICKSYAQRVVIDAKSIEQATINGVAAAGQEKIIESNFEKGKKAHDRAIVAVTSVQTALSLYQMSLNNVKGFESDSKNMQEIARLATKITKELPLVAKEVKNNPKATLTSTKMITDLSSELIQAGSYIYSIVTNGTVKLPGFPAITTYKDGYNLIDAKDRLDMTTQIIVNLRRIYNTLLQIKYQLMYAATWGRVFQQALPFHHYFLFDSKNLVDEIVGDFGQLIN